MGGDGLFHLARARKLADLGDLSLDSLNEFPDGSLHPGYAFPLWHGLLALVANVSGADPTDVVRHLPSILAPVAVLVWLEAGWSLFRRVGARAGHVGSGGCARGHGARARWRVHGAGLPATASRQLLVPGRARARARGGEATVVAASGKRGRGRLRARRRAPHVRRLPVRAVHRLRAGAGRLGTR